MFGLLLSAALLSTAQCPGGVCPSPASVRPQPVSNAYKFAPQARQPVVRVARPRFRLFARKCR